MDVLLNDQSDSCDLSPELLEQVIGGAIDEGPQYLAAEVPHGPDY